MGIPFIKMHGLGNDFILIDQRRDNFHCDEDKLLLKQWGDRRLGIGCDQIIFISPSSHSESLAKISFYNNDGSSALACGNGLRCVGWWLSKDSHKNEFTVETDSGLRHIQVKDQDHVTVSMGLPSFDLDKIPMVPNTSFDELYFDTSSIQHVIPVSIGNPHLVFIMNRDMHDEEVAEIGAMIEHSSLFPNRVNVGFAKILKSNELRLRVWERGAGLTLACGTGACAAVAAAQKLSLCENPTNVMMDGGILQVSCTPENIFLTGPIELVFQGEWIS